MWNSSAYERPWGHHVTDENIPWLLLACEETSMGQIILREISPRMWGKLTPKKHIK